MNDKNAVENGGNSIIFDAMASIAILRKRGRLTLPKHMREQMNLAAGSHFHVELVGDKIRLTPKLAKPRNAKSKDGNSQ